jgi:hypothetical protein
MFLELVDWDVPVTNDQGMCGFIVMRWSLGVKTEHRMADAVIETDTRLSTGVTSSQNNPKKGRPT